MNSVFGAGNWVDGRFETVNAATLFTAANLAMGFLAVMMSIRGYHASFGDIQSAAHYFNIAALAIAWPYYLTP